MMEKTVRISSTWVYQEIYDYPVDDLPEEWDEWGFYEQAKWVYDNCGDCYQVLAEPLSEIELTDVEVIN